MWTPGIIFVGTVRVWVWRIFIFYIYPFYPKIETDIRKPTSAQFKWILWGITVFWDNFVTSAG